MNFELKCSFQGMITIKKTDTVTGKVVEHEFRNLVLNRGLETFCAGQQMSGLITYCHVGTGNTPPAATQESLVSWLAYISTDTSKDKYFYEFGTATPHTSLTRVYRFPAGRATGNIAEIGFGTGSSSTNQGLFSRALIKDANGNVTTITVLPTEALEVTYVLKFFWPADVPQTGSVVLDGVTYNYTSRVMLRPGSRDMGTGCWNQNWTRSQGGARNANADVWTTITSPGSRTQDPTGDKRSPQPSWSEETPRPAYVAGSYYNEATFFTNQGQITTTLQAVRWSWYDGAPSMIITFDKPIPVDATQSLYFTCSILIGR